MVLEIALLDVEPSRAEAFEAAFQGTTELVAAAQGCRSMRLMRSIETPGRYHLLIEWDRVEDHTVVFRNSPQATAFRQLVWTFLRTPATAEHYDTVLLTRPSRNEG